MRDPSHGEVRSQPRCLRITRPGKLLTTRIAALACVLALTSGGVTLAETVRAPQPYVWENVPRVVAIGDAHGSYEPVVELLRESRLVDDELRWTGGQDHLVFVGDILDRGTGERALIDLVRRLQQEAPLSGGRVHLVLGNHEVMNLVRDLRYVSPAGYEGFADLERPDDRKSAWRDYCRAPSRVRRKEAELRQEFGATHPLGYFGRLQAFSPGGLYADWLIEQPAIIRIDGTVFVHAGLTEDIAELGLAEINRRVRDAIVRFWDNRGYLVNHEKLPPFAEFQTAMRDSVSIEAGARKREVRDAASRLRGYLDSLAGSPDGPLWYRGNALEDERVERQRVTDSLEALGADRMVIGHTITAPGVITSRFDGKVYRADIGLVKDSAPEALIIENDEVRRFQLDTGDLAEVVAEFPTGDGWPDDFGDFTEPQLERFLETGNIEHIRPIGRGSTRPLLLVLARDEHKRRAVYKNIDYRPDRKRIDNGEVMDRYAHEEAAYRLDRIVGLNMVPVTVIRRLNSTGRGSVQLWVAGAIDHDAMMAYGMDEELERALEAQIRRVPVWDALIGNLDRTANDKLYVRANRRLFLIDHSKAFTIDTRLERFVDPANCEIDREFRQAMASLEFKDLTRRLGPWLSKDQIRAMLDRRDELLEVCRDVE